MNEKAMKFLPICFHQFTHTKSIIWRYEKEIENDIKKINLKNPIKISLVIEAFSSLQEMIHIDIFCNAFWTFFFFPYDFASSILRINRTRSKKWRNPHSENTKFELSNSIYKTLCDILHCSKKSIRIEIESMEKKVSYLELIAFGWLGGVKHFFSSFFLFWEMK